MVQTKGDAVTTGGEIDVVRAREDTPGCAHVLHFNKCGRCAAACTGGGRGDGHVRLEAEIGGYEAAEVAHDMVERVYDAAAQLIGADGTRLRLSRTRRAPGIWRSIRCRFVPETAF